MPTLRLTLDLDVDEDLADLGDAEERESFLAVLCTERPGEELLLHSNYYGHTFGPVRVIAVEEAPDEA